MRLISQPNVSQLTRLTDIQMQMLHHFCDMDQEFLFGYVIGQKALFYLSTPGQSVQFFQYDIFPLLKSDHIVDQ